MPPPRPLGQRCRTVVRRIRDRARLIVEGTVVSSSENNRSEERLSGPRLGSIDRRSGRPLYAAYRHRLRDCRPWPGVRRPGRSDCFALGRSDDQAAHDLTRGGAGYNWTQSR